MERTRRATLATLCSLAGADCLGTANPGDTDEATTRTTTTTAAATTAETTTVDVSASTVAVSPAVVAYNSPDPVGVDGDVNVHEHPGRPSHGEPGGDDGVPAAVAGQFPLPLGRGDRRPGVSAEPDTGGHTPLHRRYRVVHFGTDRR